LAAATFPLFVKELRLSHQLSTNDVRHQVAQMVADGVMDAGVDLDIKIFPSRSFFKPRTVQGLSRGQLDMTVFPLSYAEGQRPAFNLTLMPALVEVHDHAARLNDSHFMKEIEKQMAEDDVKKFWCMAISRTVLSARKSESPNRMT